MPVFNPALPLNNSLIASGELRNQFNSLNELIGDLQVQMDERAYKPNGVGPLTNPISNPPTQAQVTEIRDKVNELLAALNV